MRTALSIAGTDPTGGAGIQADLKTMTLNGVFAMSAVTALVAQNTTGVIGIMEVTPEFLQKQIDAVFEDIRPDAVKIGMVSSAGLIATIADRLKAYQAEHIVVDPVMVTTSGSRLIEEEAVETLEKMLLPLASVVTPNIPEAEILSGLPSAMKRIWKRLRKKSAGHTDAPYCAKAATVSTTPMTCCSQREKAHGSWVNALTIQIHMGPAALCPAPLPRILPRGREWKRQSKTPSDIFPERLRICSIWVQAAAP